MIVAVSTPGDLCLCARTGSVCVNSQFALSLLSLPVSLAGCLLRGVTCISICIMSICMFRSRGMWYCRWWKRGPFWWKRQIWDGLWWRRWRKSHDSVVLPRLVIHLFSDKVNCCQVHTYLGMHICSSTSFFPSPMTGSTIIVRNRTLQRVVNIAYQLNFYISGQSNPRRDLFDSLLQSRISLEALS